MKKQEKSMHMDKITMGVCYYPEHWAESLWESDLSRMLETGIKVIRIAEFAWNKFEPEEGIFTFDFFDRFMTVVEKTPIKVIFCTPTATPPAWASHNYPEILNGTKDGVLFRHGHRRHYNYNSPKYQQLTRDIVMVIGSHYGKHPSIIGWQIDNEINCEIDEFYSESDNNVFRTFLRKKYSTLEQLNKAWGTVFWNQGYTAWEQVFLPRPTVGYKTNPHLNLDYIRFVSDSACRFTALQADILRHHVREGTFITTNGIFNNVDNHRQVQENLDFMMFDSYPNFAHALEGCGYNQEQDGLLGREWGRNLSEARSMSPNFGVMEQQSGPGGWTSSMEAPSPKPGQMTLWTMQSIAHGADYVGYFRWRTCTFGEEIYWHGILDYDNRDNRRLKEAVEISNKFCAIAEVAGTKYQAAFAVIREYDNIWDAQYDVWHKRVENVSQSGWFRAAQVTHTPMDYLYITEDTVQEDLSRYPLLVYPHATILSERTATLLERYVTEGGTLIMGCRTGYKDTNGHCVMTPKPGLVATLCGTDVIDCTFVGPTDEPIGADWSGNKVEAAVFNDILSPLEGAQVLAVYSSNYYAGQPALIKNHYGQGDVYYFGGAFCRETAEAFLRVLGVAEPYKNVITVPDCCELAVREKNGVSYLFVLNYSAEDAMVALHHEMTDLYKGKEISGSVTLRKYETSVYKLQDYKITLT